MEVDRRYCLVHATHATASELAAMARSRAVVGLCPTTEANLGDGVFALDEYSRLGGAFGIGSDSHVAIDPRDELRSAEYALRLQQQKRAILSSTDHPHVGAWLYGNAVEGGAQALGQARSGIRPGAMADLVVLNTEESQFAGVPEEALLDAWVFAPRPGSVREVWVGGQRVVQDGRHVQRASIETDYRLCMKELRKRL